MLFVAVFAIATAFILYILFGYPALLHLLAARWSKPVRREPFVARVSLLIAVHNGERFVAEKLASIFALNFPASQLETIIACDGCSDRTAELAEQIGGERVRVLRLPKGGKATALNEAMRLASGQVFVFTDIRQQFDPACLSYLLQSFTDPQVGAVSGQLVIRKGDSHEKADVGLYWRYEFWLRTQLSRIDSLFGATGACYALRRELAVPIPAGTLLDDMYEPLAAFFRGYRLIVDERALIFDYPTTLDAEFHRKVRTLAGNYQILAAYPALLGPRNRMWFHFVSYKFGRLLLPLALLAVLLSSFGLPQLWRIIALTGQAGFYLLAAIDPWIGTRSAVKRLSSITRTFVVLMLATVMAARILFTRSSEDLWKQTRVADPKA